eukprot:TRINITY_DN66071_c0_g1_i1.p1 TRINITY_DN66071_c0_g1~~TRINITY_DN66071_c0_g1_i1.p1  ORF type:complete len:542 (+),score=250.00 TRINITY_DN66071_c0_g1_i1:101-1627(+)
MAASEGSTRVKRQDRMCTLLVQKISAIAQRLSEGAPLSEAGRAHIEAQVSRLMRSHPQQSDLLQVAREALTAPASAPAASQLAPSAPPKGGDHRQRPQQRRDSVVSLGSRAPPSAVSAGAVAASRVSASAAAAPHSAAAAPSAAAAAQPAADHSPLRTRLQQQSAADDWARMLLADVVDWNAELRRQREAQRNRMQVQRAALDEQMAERKALESDRAQQERQYAEQERAQREIWRAETLAMEQRRRDTVQQERRARDEQIRSLQEAREREQAERRREDERVARELRDAAAREKEERQRQRERARAEVKRSQEYNEAQRSVRVQQQEQEAAMDAVHQQAYLERLQRQDAEREEALKQIFTRQGKHSGLASQLYQAVQRKAAADEARAEAEAQRQLEAKQREEELRLRRQQAANAKMRVHLAEQLGERVAQKQKQKQERVAELAAVSADVRQAEEEAARKKRERRERDSRHKRELEQQMQGRRETAIMSEQERRLNLGRLQRVQARPPLL